MRWRMPSPRLRVSTLLVLVVLSAPAIWVGLYFLSPTWRLARAIGAGQPDYLRREAVMELGNVPSHEAESAIDLLMGILADPSPRVRESALAALSMHGARAARAVPTILKLTGDPDRFVRYSACASLGTTASEMAPGPGRDAVIAGLKAALADADPQNQLIAAVTLIRFGEVDAAVPVIALRATDPDDEYLRSHARHYIRGYGMQADALAPALAPLVAYPEPGRRRLALEFLMEIGSSEAVTSALGAALRSDDPEVRRWAAEKLESLKPSSVVPTPAADPSPLSEPDDRGRTTLHFPRKSLTSGPRRHSRS